jgi:hypothetical protein
MPESGAADSGFFALRTARAKLPVLAHGAKPPVMLREETSARLLKPK